MGLYDVKLKSNFDNLAKLHGTFKSLFNVLQHIKTLYDLSHI